LFIFYLTTYGGTLILPYGIPSDHASSGVRPVAVISYLKIRGNSGVAIGIKKPVGKTDGPVDYPHIHLKYQKITFRIKVINSTAKLCAKFISIGYSF